MYYIMSYDKKLTDSFVNDDVGKKTCNHAAQTYIKITIATANNSKVIIHKHCYTDEHKNNSKIVNQFFHIYNRDRTVSRRSEPSSRAALIGEQPNPWDLLQPQDATSRHRGAKPPRRCGLLGEISLLSPG